MRSILKALGAAATVAGCLLTAGTGTAQAATAEPSGLYAPSELVLAVGHGDSAATATFDRAVSLACAPRPSGTHPDAAAACAELEAVEGQFADLVVSSTATMCTKEWNPVVMTADGVWEGRRVSWSVTFANPCAMKADLATSTALAF